MSGVLGFAPASNKHLIASVKPIRAASAKGLPVPFTLAPACQFTYRRQNSEMFPYKLTVHKYNTRLKAEKNIVPESIVSNKTRKERVMLQPKVLIGLLPCWARQEKKTN